MVIHRPAQSDDHKLCGSGDMKILANTIVTLQMRDIRDSICPVTSAIFIFSKEHDMSCVTRVYENIRHFVLGFVK